MVTEDWLLPSLDDEWSLSWSVTEQMVIGQMPTNKKVDEYPSSTISKQTKQDSLFFSFPCLFTFPISLVHDENLKTIL